METSKKKFSFWLTFAAILSGLQLIAGVMVSVMCLKLNMFPGIYMAAIIMVLLALAALVFLMLYWTEVPRCQPDYEGKRHYVKRFIWTLISVLIIAICLIAIAALDQLLAAMNAVTEVPSVVSENVNVYVMDEDPAESIEDAITYTFGITEAYDYEHTKETITMIRNLTGTEIETKTYDDVFAMVDGLYSGEVGAIILNETYVDVMADLDDYMTYEEDTRIIYSNAVETSLSNGVDITKSEADQDGNGIADGEEALSELGNSFVVYISGSDTRSTRLARSRSDVNILAIVNPDTKQILLVNTPRDYYVYTSISPSNQDKLTHCGIYGINCSMDTLANLYGVPVEYYAQINFTGFETLVDAIGGVNVYSDASFSAGSYSFTEGYNYMDGAKALAFARERHALQDGDHARGRHQMALIKAMIEKLTSSTALISNYTGIMDSLTGMFATNVSTDKIGELVRQQLSEGGSWNITSYAVTGSNSSGYTYSMPNQTAYIMIPDTSSVATAKSMIQQVIDGQVPSAE